MLIEKDRMLIDRYSVEGARELVCDIIPSLPRRSSRAKSGRLRKSSKGSGILRSVDKKK